MDAVKEITCQCFKTVTEYHSDKIREGCSGITEEQVRHAISLNWGMMKEEASDLYATVVTMLEDTEIQF